MWGDDWTDEEVNEKLAAVLRENDAEYAAAVASFQSIEFIWAMAVKFDCFPSREYDYGRKNKVPKWFVSVPTSGGTWVVQSERPERAVALGIIARYGDEE